MLVQLPSPITDPGARAREPEKKSGPGLAVPCALPSSPLAAGPGGTSKIYRPKHQQAAAPEDDYEEGMDAYNDFEDDGPLWDEDDPEPGEEDEA